MAVDTSEASPARERTVYLVRRLWRDYIRKHRWRILTAIGFMAGVAAATTALAQLMEPVMDDVLNAPTKDWNALIGVAVAVFVAFAVKGTCTYAQNVIMNRLGQRVISDLQFDMFRHLMRADLAFFHGTATGKLISRFTNDTNMLRNASAKTFTGIGKDSLTLVGLTGLMFYQDWVLALFAFVVFPVAVLPILRLGKRMRKLSGSTQSEMGEFTMLLDETLQGARHVKAYGMEDYEIGRAEGAIERIYRLVDRAGRTRSLMYPIMETLGGIAVVGVVSYGGWQVFEGAKTSGQFVAFMTALIMAYEPLKKIANLHTNLQEGLAAAARIFGLLDTESRITDPPGARDLAIKGGEIRFTDVHFAYGPDAPALEGITLTAPAGRTTALVGPSGAGKSTILNLIPRFYDVTNGRVLVDDQAVDGVTLASLRAHIALVSQEISLFNDTVRANIAYGRPGARDADIETAARHAGAHDFITDLDQGYDTVVGDHGVRLSGGQRQRIAIARAMLKNAPILLLDEATSALDTETERQVQAALTDLMRGRTTVVIAHRLSTVVDADVIHVLEDGRLIESGTHHDLIGRDGLYARLWRMQAAEEASVLLPRAAAGD